jgi:GNAT superfamily N-acetyltransferase
MSQIIDIQCRKATETDVSLLAKLNRQLIQDEGHRNHMALPELAERMRNWLQSGYEAIVFEQDGTPVAYALYRQDPDSIYLRQFFVDRRHRRLGIGRQAMQILLSQVWPRGLRITVDVLVKNRIGYAFWRSIGFQDYAITLEMARE